MQPGTKLGRFVIGPQLGQGAFGKIYAARDFETGLLYAIKNESARAERKTLSFETKILRRIQECLYFPRLFESGETNSLTWIAMELVGPSLSALIKQRESQKLSLSTSLRVCRHILLALRSLHNLGFIHRDIKPGNILIRLNCEGLPPICLIDFGLARIYVDQKTGEHEKPRQRTGFRGTKTYASLNAHSSADLSRRDDLISLFYFCLDIILGGLPWKGLGDNSEVAKMKQKFDMKEAVDEIEPKLYQIWKHVNSLGFEERPNYEMIESILNEIMADHNIKENDEWDWAEFLENYRKTLTGEFGVTLRIDVGEDVYSYNDEVGLSVNRMEKANAHETGPTSHLLPRLQSYSVMQASELDERDQCGCCGC